MPYSNRDPKKDKHFDNHPHGLAKQRHDKDEDHPACDLGREPESEPQMVVSILFSIIPIFNITLTLPKWVPIFPI